MLKNNYVTLLLEYIRDYLKIEEEASAIVEEIGKFLSYKITNLELDFPWKYTVGDLKLEINPNFEKRRGEYIPEINTVEISFFVEDLVDLSNFITILQTYTNVIYHEVIHYLDFKYDPEVKTKEIVDDSDFNKYYNNEFEINANIDSFIFSFWQRMQLVHPEYLINKDIDKIKEEFQKYIKDKVHLNNQSLFGEFFNNLSKENIKIVNKEIKDRFNVSVNNHLKKESISDIENVFYENLCKISNNVNRRIWRR